MVSEGRSGVTNICLDKKPSLTVADLAGNARINNLTNGLQVNENACINTLTNSLQVGDNTHVTSMHE